MSWEQSMEQTWRDLWKINPDIYCQRDHGWRNGACIQDQLPLQHVKLDVRFTSKKGKKERISIFTKEEHLMGGGRGWTRPGKLLTRCLSKHCPRFLLPIIHPCLWSLNPNGRRLFHLVAKGAVGAPQPHIPKPLCFCRNTHTSTSCHRINSTHTHAHPINQLACSSSMWARLHCLPMTN